MVVALPDRFGAGICSSLLRPACCCLLSAFISSVGGVRACARWCAYVMLIELSVQILSLFIHICVFKFRGLGALDLEFAQFYVACGCLGCIGGFPGAPWFSFWWPVVVFWFSVLRLVGPLRALPSPWDPLGPPGSPGAPWPPGAACFSVAPSQRRFHAVTCSCCVQITF